MKRPKKDVHDLMWELLDAIEDIQTWWNATDEQAKFDRKVAKIRKQFEKL